MLRYYHLGSDNEIEDRKIALTCPECGESKDIDYNVSGDHGEKEYACLCNKCNNMWDFYEIEE